MSRSSVGRSVKRFVASSAFEICSLVVGVSCVFVSFVDISFVVLASVVLSSVVVSCMVVMGILAFGVLLLEFRFCLRSEGMMKNCRVGQL